jgi:hypothetical protein
VPCCSGLAPAPCSSLAGYHKVKMRLATGEVKTYFYAWRGGPQIKAKPGTPILLALTTMPTPNSGDLARAC